jgi:hypothetical protein
MSRFGVRLEDKSQDSDGSIIIPEELEEILKGDTNASRMTDDELMNQIDGISLSKKEMNEIHINCKWVEDLLKQDPATSIGASRAELKCLAKGPLLLSERDIIRVSTPEKERYDRVWPFNRVHRVIEVMKNTNVSLTIRNRIM